jgi:hypothetical protein
MSSRVFRAVRAASGWKFAGSISIIVRAIWQRQRRMVRINLWNEGQ